MANFLAMGLDYGPYSSEPKVRDHIRRLCAEGRGWASDDGYMVAVALFTRNPDVSGDRADQLLRALQLPPERGPGGFPEEAAGKGSTQQGDGSWPRCHPEADRYALA